MLLIALSVSFSVDQRIQDADIAVLDSSDEVLWLDPQQPSGLVLMRPPAAAAQSGSVLILASADVGPNASTHFTRARLQLPFYGWRTYFARLPIAPGGHDSTVTQDALQALHAAVLEYARFVRARGPTTLVIIAEGAIGEICVSLRDRLDVDGLVLINLQADSVERDMLRAVTLPSLVLQENPNYWPKENPLGPDVELHVLSRVDARREDNRLLRKIRGWFKRRFAAQA